MDEDNGKYFHELSEKKQLVIHLENLIFCIQQMDKFNFTKDVILIHSPQLEDCFMRSRITIAQIKIEIERTRLRLEKIMHDDFLNEVNK